MTTLGIPPFNPDKDQWLRSLSTAVNQLIQGKTNNTGSVTLRANFATTALVLAPGQLGANTTVKLTPTTANASAEIGAGTLYISAKNVSTATVTITHANNAQTDRIFDYAFIG